MLSDQVSPGLPWCKQKAGPGLVSSGCREEQPGCGVPLGHHGMRPWWLVAGGCHGTGTQGARMSATHGEVALQAVGDRQEPVFSVPCLAVEDR